MFTRVVTSLNKFLRTYVVSSPVVALYYTELVGDAKVLPTLKATAGFSGIAVIDADPYLSGGANMYVNQVGDAFFPHLRNALIGPDRITFTGKTVL